jgi:hypothetical protein
LGRHHIDAEALSQARPEVVWRLLADVSTWSSWGPWQEATLAREGKPDPDGVGAVRRLRRGPVVTTEEVVGFDPPRRLAYDLRSGLPLRDYHAEVTLSPADGTGTRIRWQSTFDGAQPGVGAVLRPLLARFVADVARRLAVAAEGSAG